MIELSSQITAKTKENILAYAREIVMNDGKRVQDAITSLSGNTDDKFDEVSRNIAEFSAGTTNKLNVLKEETDSTISDLSGRTSIFDDNGVPVDANPISFQSNAEYVIATVDSNGNLLYGIRTDGSVYQCATDDLTQKQIDALRNVAMTTISTLSADTFNTIHELSAQTSIFDENGVPVEANPISVISNAEFLTATIDANGNLLYGIRTDGSVYQCATDDLTKARIDELSDTLNNEFSTKIKELSDKIDRNWVGVEYVESDGKINAILGGDSKIKSIDVDEDGNITFTQEIN